MGAAVVWFRRDLRVRDQPTFLSAANAADRAVAVFVLDPALLEPAGDARTEFLRGCLRALDTALAGRLLVVRGEPEEVIPRVADAVGARTVHVAADFGPYGKERDARVEHELAAGDARLVRAGSPYAVAPGRVRTTDGGRFRVFTPFHRAWLANGWPAPADTDAGTVNWIDPRDLDLDAEEVPAGSSAVAALPEPGENAALRRWQAFLDDGVESYGHDRDRPDLAGTSRLSPYLKFGCVHPRTVLADLAREGVGDAFAREIAWREFYADVLDRRPDSAHHNYVRDFDALPTESGAEADRLFTAWREGRTGFPIVDAGMRQLRTEGWMHNRVRMITASFLVKDLHLPWQWGARHFMRLLVDGDLASNQHNWQWVAGCGTDAAPYFRVFNPTTQGERFDPDGEYVRTHVPELADVPGKHVHQPWKGHLTEGTDYPRPVVDHDEERLDALARYDAVRNARANR